MLPQILWLRRFGMPVVAMLFGGLIAARASGQTMTFSSDRDAPILPAAGLANTNFGGSGILAVGSVAGGDERSLVSFDVSALSGQFSQINAITLRLFVDGFNGTANLNTHVHAITPANRAWGEGTGVESGVGPTVAGDNTWNERQRSTAAWAGSPGLGTAVTDYDSFLLASEAFPSGGYPAPGTAVDFQFNGTPAQLTSLINSWLVDNVSLSQANPGLLLLDPNGAIFGGMNRVRFDSAENGNPNLQPLLIVEFTSAAVPEPTSITIWCVLAAGLAWGGSRWLRRKPQAA